MTPPLFIPYYRVSTDRQGRSGLGLEAQQQAVAAFIAQRGGVVVETFTEIESGRKNDRPQLAAALSICRCHRATLVIAKLDRLARNVHFISGLLESAVDFVAVDMPEANKLTIHILAAVAEHEREMISQRTKEALQAAKQRGVTLGSPTPHHGAEIAARVRQQKATEYRAGILPVLRQLQADGLSLRQIAETLNQRDVPTARGGKWYARTVKNVLAY
ncbi:MAG: recombinase family protein [Candidatus Competibacteraceae bacterium]|nr:recombinase family protein [Candidatus Competibacteraceae bacterium]